MEKSYILHLKSLRACYMVIPAFLWAMPLLALRCKRHYGTGLSAAPSRRV